MGFDPEALLREQQKRLEKWYRRSTKDIEAKKDDLVQRGRAAWHDGTLAGQAIVARTQQDLQQLGTTTRNVASGVSRARTSVDRQVAKAAGQASKVAASAQQAVKAQGGAVLRGASDGLTFGMGDQASAALRAGPFQEGWKTRYDANIAQEHAQDKYDSEHNGVARALGEVGGTAASFLVDPAAAGLVMGRLVLAGARAGPRLAKLGYEAAELAPRLINGAKDLGQGFRKTGRIAPLTNGLGDGLRWTTYAGAAGAGNGILGQAVADRLSDRESTPVEYGASALGGLADGVVTRFAGAKAGGFAGGAASEAAHQVFLGEPIDGAGIARAGSANAAIGGASSKISSGIVKSFSPRLKGQLGEQLSLAKSRLQGENVEWFTTKKGRETLRTRVPVQGGYTVPDQVLLPKRSSDPRRYVEAKFGEQAQLSKRQASAREKFADNYRIDHWLDSDVGAMVGGTFGSMAQPIVQDRLGRFPPLGFPATSQRQVVPHLSRRQLRAS